MSISSQHLKPLLACSLAALTLFWLGCSTAPQSRPDTEDWTDDDCLTLLCMGDECGFYPYQRVPLLFPSGSVSGMNRFFWIDEDDAVAEQYGGEVHGAPRWKLPGVQCPDCGVTWSGTGHRYPCIDLSPLPEHQAFEKARPEPFAEFARLRERVRPLAPLHALLPPGTGFGPLEGTASGRFAAFVWMIDALLVQQEALKKLQAEGTRGLLGCETHLRFRQKNPPDLLELQVEPRGRLHPSCLPAGAPHPCATCGRHGLRRPEAPILDASSLPTDLDLFRVGNFATMFIGTERFVASVQRLGLDGLTIRELPLA